jgi:hypothetical protein
MDARKLLDELFTARRSLEHQEQVFEKCVMGQAYQVAECRGETITNYIGYVVNVTKETLHLRACIPAQPLGRIGVIPSVFIELEHISVMTRLGAAKE